MNFLKNVETEKVISLLRHPLHIHRTSQHHRLHSPRFKLLDSFSNIDKL